jgi:hypothetical protein
VGDDGAVGCWWLVVGGWYCSWWLVNKSEKVCLNREKGEILLSLLNFQFIPSHEEGLEIFHSMYCTVCAADTRTRTVDS